MIKGETMKKFIAVCIVAVGMCGWAWASAIQSARNAHTAEVEALQARLDYKARELDMGLAKLQAQQAQAEAQDAQAKLAKLQKAFDELRYTYCGG
jgi:multidrug efflux pump subunit AcrA (membrane-fusion protein)